MQRLAALYMSLTVLVGAALCGCSSYHLPVAQIDAYFLLLMLVTALIVSRVAVRIPQINTNITVDDTAVFIALLIYGGEAATLLGAVAGFCCVLRISKKLRNILFAPAALACAVFVNAKVLEFLFGSTTQLFHRGASAAISAICLMALLQYLFHTALVAVANALKDNQPIWHMWSQNFLWISITYFAGAAASGIIVSSIGSARFYALIIAVPIIAIV